jgi:hypothetical protein
MKTMLGPGVCLLTVCAACSSSSGSGPREPPPRITVQADTASDSVVSIALGDVGQGACPNGAGVEGFESSCTQERGSRWHADPSSSTASERG